MKNFEKALRRNDNYGTITEFIFRLKLSSEANLSAFNQRQDFNITPNIKRNESYIKKIKQLCDENKDLLVNETNQLNLKKYISEVAIALGESKLKYRNQNKFTIVIIFQNWFRYHCIYQNMFSAAPKIRRFQC